MNQKFSKAKYPARKEQLHEEIKSLRNAVTNNLQQNRGKYYKQNFDNSNL